MGSEDERGAGRGVCPDRVEQSVRRVVIELGGRLVGDDYRRVPRERQREGRTRLLAAGELGRVGAEPVLDPERPEELERLVVGVLALLGEREVRDEVRSRALGDVRHDVPPVLAQRGSRGAAELLPGDPELAARGAVEARDRAQQRRLPAPRRADDCGHLAGLELRIDVV